MRKKYDISDCHAEAHKHEGYCLSLVYKDNKSLLKWKCKEGHIWETSFGSVKRTGGRWCRKCANNARKDTISMFHDIAKSRNGICKSTIYINSETLLIFQCNVCNSIWSARPQNITRGDWCKKCAYNNKKDNIDTFHSIAKDKNGKCKSTIYVNRKTPLEFQCNVCELVWFATPRHIKKSGSWCPHCSRPGKRQKELFAVVKDLFPEYKVLYNFKGFSWLKTKKGGCQEIDIFIPELGIAIEYDGIQHTKPVSFGSKDKEQVKRDFIRRKQLDRMKTRKIKAHPKDVKKLVRFNPKDSFDPENVIIKMVNAGIRELG